MGVIILFTYEILFYIHYQPSKSHQQQTIVIPSLYYEPFSCKNPFQHRSYYFHPSHHPKSHYQPLKKLPSCSNPFLLHSSSNYIFASLQYPSKWGPIVPNSTKYNEINIIFVLEDSEMAQAEYRLKTTRSRLDYELFQVTLLRYDPQLIEDVYIDLPTSLRIRPQTQIGRVFLKNQPEGEEMQQQGKGLLLGISFSGQLQAMAEHFERIDAGGKSVFHLKAPQKKGQLPILSMRECDHRPRNETFLYSNLPGQSTASSPHRRNIPDSVTICEGCQTVLWKYYEREEIPITLGELCKMNSAGGMRQLLEDFQWSIILNQQFTPRTELGRCAGQQMTLPYLAKAVFLLDFTENRKRLREDTVIMRIRRVICKHEKVMDDCCQFCLQQVKQQHLSQFTNYLFQNESKASSVLVTGSALRQHEEMYIEGLLSNNKAMIILDLDNTILHSCEISDLDIKTVLGLKDFYLIPKIDCPFQEEKGRRDLIVVKMRPYFKHFLYVITKLYQVYVYTKGTRVYAQEICKYIRAQYAGEDRTHPYLSWQSQKLLFLQGKKSFATNIISRDEDSNLQSKSFGRILPTKTEYHLILDDRRDVWSNSPSWFFTREYYYFLSKGKKQTQETPASENADDIGHYLGSSAEIPMAEMKGGLIEEYKMIKLHYPEKKDLIMQVNTRNDYFLLFAAYALRKIHKNFFEALKLEKQEGEKQREGSTMVAQEQEGSNSRRKNTRINLAYQYSRTKQFLKGLKIQCFLGEGQDENNNNTIRRAKKMGAIFTDQSPQFAIRANDLMKQTKRPQIGPIPADSIPVPAIEVPIGEYYAKEKAELKELFDKNVPVVSQSWIHYCYEFHYPFSSKEFMLADPFQLEVNHEDFSAYIDKEAKLIIEKIEDEMRGDCNMDHRRDGVVIHPQPIRHKKDKKQPEKKEHHLKSII